MKATGDSPYLQPQRLAEVIAGVQVLGIHRYYQDSFAGWQRKIDGVASEERAVHWMRVFREHPEFFRIDSKEKEASLVIRRTFAKRYDAVAERLLMREESQALDQKQRRRLSRRPLNSEEVLTLINAAIELHARAIAHKQERRWWVDLAIGLTGVLVGAIATMIGAWIGQ